MEKETITPETLPGGADVTPPSGAEAEPEVVSLKEVLSQALGKDFPSDEVALQAVADTFKYVGKVGKFRPLLDQLQAKTGGEKELITLMENLINGQPAPTPAPETKPEADPNKFVSRDEFDAANFYGKHPEYEAHKELIGALRTQSGKSLDEVVSSDAFKGIYEKAKAHDDSEKSKSVLHTNPRLGQATDKITQAREALKQDNHEEAKAKAVEAVLDTLG